MNLCRRNLIAISDQNNILIKDTILNNIIIGLSNSNGYTKKSTNKLKDKLRVIAARSNGMSIEGKKSIVESIDKWKGEESER